VGRPRCSAVSGSSARDQGAVSCEAVAGKSNEKNRRIFRRSLWPRSTYKAHHLDLRTSFRRFCHSRCHSITICVCIGGQGSLLENPRQAMFTPVSMLRCSMAPVRQLARPGAGNRHFHMLPLFAAVVVLSARLVWARNCESAAPAGLTMLATPSGTLWMLLRGRKHPILSYTEAARLGEP